MSETNSSLHTQTQVLTGLWGQWYVMTVTGHIAHNPDTLVLTSMGTTAKPNTVVYKVWLFCRPVSYPLNSTVSLGTCHLFLIPGKEFTSFLEWKAGLSWECAEPKLHFTGAPSYGSSLRARKKFTIRPEVVLRRLWEERLRAWSLLLTRWRNWGQDE